MIVEKKITQNSEMDQDILKKIRAYKEKYSPLELKSILSLMENPISKMIIKKLWEI